VARSGREGTKDDDLGCWVLEVLKLDRAHGASQRFLEKATGPTA